MIKYFIIERVSKKKYLEEVEKAKETSDMRMFLAETIPLDGKMKRIAVATKETEIHIDLEMNEEGQ